MSDEVALPFTAFDLTLHRTGGFAGIRHTLELRWDGETRTLCSVQGQESRTVAADAGRVRALWDALEACGFWELESSFWSRFEPLGGLFLGVSGRDLLQTRVTASAVVGGQRRRAGLSFSLRQADPRSLAALALLDRFFSGQEMAA